MLSTERAPLAGAILCGGESRRMGRSKALLDLDGASLLERTVTRMRTVANPVLLATGVHDLDHVDCVRVRDAVIGRGPLAGLVAALRASPHQLCAVVAVDMPDMAADLLEGLAALWDGEDVLVPLSSRGPEPLHAVYSRSILDTAEREMLSGDGSLHSLFERVRVRHIAAAELVDPGVAARFAVNLNTPADVTVWRRAGAAPQLRQPRQGPPRPRLPGSGAPPRTDPR